MPNFLVTPEEMNQSRESAEETRRDNEPVMEEYAGQNFPYRGIETHGVEPTDDPTNMPDWREDGRMVPVLYVPESVDVEPIPVRIVNTGGMEVDKWRVATAYAGISPTQLIGRNVARTNLKIRNLDGTAIVYVSPDSTVSTFSGFPLRPGETVELKSTDEVWAVSDTADTVLSVLWEYTVEVP